MVREVLGGTGFKLWGWAETKKEASRAVILQCVASARSAGVIKNYITRCNPRARKFLRGLHNRTPKGAEPQTRFDILKAKSK